MNTVRESNNMVSSLSKLQTTVIKQEEKIIKLQDKLAETTQENSLLKLKLKKLQENFDKTIEEKVNKAVELAVAKVTEKYEKIIKDKDQRIFELETRLNINSDNSSLPSSKTPIYKTKICNSRKVSGEKVGRKEGHKKDCLAPFKDEEVTDIVEHDVRKCPNCNSTNLKLIREKNRDELDIEVKVKKIRHKFYEYQCMDCGKIIKSNIPINLHAENQYGSSVKTIGLVLSNYGFVAYNRIRKIISGLTNGEINPTEGYLVKLQKKASDKLSNFVFDVKEKILKSKMNYWDDTVIRIGEKEKACLRVYTDTMFVLFKANLSKGTEGMDEDGILQNLPNDCAVMHDHLLHNYCDNYSYKNIECNAHISRKLEGITQNTKVK